MTYYITLIFLNNSVAMKVNINIEYDGEEILDEIMSQLPPDLPREKLVAIHTYDEDSIQEWYFVGEDF